tara:strand:+ start:2234 stop:2767 length:534 start_codon:yes stop_codon:yes gene_type:complete
MPTLPRHPNVVRLERQTTTIGTVGASLLLHSARRFPRQTLDICQAIDMRIGKPEARGQHELPGNRGTLLFGPHHIMGSLSVNADVLITEQGISFNGKALILDTAVYFEKAHYGKTLGDVIASGNHDIDKLALLEKGDEENRHNTSILASIPIIQDEHRWIDIRLAVEHACTKKGRRS